MTTQTEKISQKQAAKLIGSRELHILGTIAEQHERLTISKEATRLVPLEGGNAIYVYVVKLSDSQTGDYFVFAKMQDGIDWLDKVGITAGALDRTDFDEVAEAVFRGRIFIYGRSICRVLHGTIVDGVDYQDVEFDGDSVMIKSATLLADIASGEIILG